MLGVSLNKLRASATKTFSVKERSSFTLHGAVVDHDLVSHTGQSFAANKGDFMQEVVGYAIIDAPFRSIDSVSLIPYSAVIDLKSNYALQPSFQDTFARAVFEGKAAAN